MRRDRHGNGPILRQAVFRSWKSREDAKKSDQIFERLGNGGAQQVGVIASAAKQSRVAPHIRGLLRYARNDVEGSWPVGSVGPIHAASQ